MVNFWANLGAMLVVLLTGHIDAILSSTLCQKLFLGVLMKEDVQVAFNLLGCRPIDLAVLLLALQRRHTFLVPSPARIAAHTIVYFADSVSHGTLLTHARFKHLLVTIAFQISIEECFVGSRALAIQGVPLLPGSLVLGDCLLKPSTEAIFWVGRAASLHSLANHFPSGAILLVGSGTVQQIWAEAAFVLALHVRNIKAMKLAAFCFHVHIQAVDIGSA